MPRAAHITRFFAAYAIISPLFSPCHAIDIIDIQLDVAAAIACYAAADVIDTLSDYVSLFASATMPVFDDDVSRDRFTAREYRSHVTRVTPFFAMPMPLILMLATVVRHDATLRYAYILSAASATTLFISCFRSIRFHATLHYTLR